MTTAVETAMFDTYYIKENLKVLEISKLKGLDDDKLWRQPCWKENLKVLEISKLKGLDDDKVIFGILKSGTKISVLGSGVDLLTASDLKYEGGTNNWVVNCKCNVRDDDGEKMIACNL
ncbi:hypothetical protein L2E82_52364 [Cichorium intybus]|nr:hypothetical protein L2E82_52364 [Cichorium intybus]